MRVKCISNISVVLDEKAGYPDDYQFESLIIGTIFEVYSIGHWDDYMFYLLKVDHQDPDLTLDPVWFPYEWFEIIDEKIPDSWYFNFIGTPEKGKIATIMGYKEIALDYNHHFGLMEREKIHLDIFYAMRDKVDR